MKKLLFICFLTICTIGHSIPISNNNYEEEIQLLRYTKDSRVSINISAYYGGLIGNDYDNKNAKQILKIESNLNGNYYVGKNIYVVRLTIYFTITGYDGESQNNESSVMFVVPAPHTYQQFSRDGTLYTRSFSGNQNDIQKIAQKNPKDYNKPFYGANSAELNFIKSVVINSIKIVEQTSEEYTGNKGLINNSSNLQQSGSSNNNGSSPNNGSTLNNIQNMMNTQNQINNNISNAKTNTNGSYQSTNNQAAWKSSQQNNNNALIQAQKVKEEQMQAEINKKTAYFNQAHDKLAQELKERQQKNDELHKIALAKIAFQEEAVNQIASGAVSVINMFKQNADRNRAAREAAAAEAEARAERKRLREEAEAERRALQLEMRKSLFTQYPDVKLPLSSQNYGQDELYYFAYNFDESKIEQDNASLYTTPVFQIHKYGDGTWPYKNEILDKLSNVNNGKIFKVVGFFLDKSMAEEQRKTFTEDAEKFKISNYQAQIFKMKENTNKSIGIDFWGNPIKN